MQFSFYILAKGRALRALAVMYFDILATGRALAVIYFDILSTGRALAVMYFDILSTGRALAVMYFDILATGRALRALAVMYFDILATGGALRALAIMYFDILATGRPLRALAGMYFRIILRVTEKLFCSFSTDLAGSVSTGSSTPCLLTEPEDSYYRDHKSPTRVCILRQMNPDVMFDQRNY